MEPIIALANRVHTISAVADFCFVIGISSTTEKLINNVHIMHVHYTENAK